MSTIDRQAAINEIEHHIRTAEQPYQLTDADRIMNHAFEIAASCIYNLPSAQPERKTGKWILKDHMFECDKCGCRINRYPFKGNIWNYYYCPNCGAKMEDNR